MSYFSLESFEILDPIDLQIFGPVSKNMRYLFGSFRVDYRLFEWSILLTVIVIVAMVSDDLFNKLLLLLFIDLVD